MPAEQAAGVATRQVCPRAGDLQPGAFTQAQHGDVVFLQELLDPFRACLALMRTARIRIEVVGGFICFSNERVLDSKHMF